MNMQLLAAFVVAAIVLVVVPGPNIVFIAGTAVARGRRAGIAAALGVELATLVHGLIAAAGLAAIVAAHPLALTIIRLAGAGYLAWLGIRTLARPPERLEEVQRTGGRSLLDGFWVNLLNPKVIIFFLAFLPQFADLTARWPIGLQVVTYALIIVGIGLVNSSVWVFGIAAIAEQQQGSRIAWVRRWVVGVLYLTLAAVAALGNIS